MQSRTMKALWALLVSLVLCGAVYAQDYHRDHRDRDRDDHWYSHRHSDDRHWDRDDDGDHDRDRMWHERHEREEAYRRNNGYYNNGYYNGPYYGGNYGGAPYYGGGYGYPSYGYGYPSTGYGGYGYGGYPGGYAQNNDTQRAYSAGYNNGVNDRSRNKPLNLKTGNWHGINLQAYERGYEDGYRGGYSGRRW